MSRPRVGYIGDRNCPEFAEPLRWLAERAHVVFSADIESAVALISSRDNPFDLFIVAQCRPGEHTHIAFDSLRRAAPLTPIVCLLGSYCEGEGRSGKPWPGAARVYAHQFVARLGRQFEQWESLGAMAWALPFTKTEEDRLLASSQLDKHPGSARVAVVSEQRETASALDGFLRSAGFTVVGPSDGALDDDVEVAIWDCAADFAASQSSFERLVARWPRSLIVALLGFPRVADQAAALACGAAAVVSKPFLVDDLLWQLRQCLVRPSSRRDY